MVDPTVNPVGVGSKVIGAGVKVLAMVAGAAARLTGGGGPAMAMATSEDPLELGRAVRRIHYLEDLLVDARAEVAKVEGLYDAWCSARMEKHRQRLAFVLAIAELPAAPEQIAASLDAVAKASTSLGDLSSAGAELRVKALTRQVDQRTQELELEGINAEDFAELTRLTQQVEIARTQGSLAPPSELSRLEGVLARQTTRRDLDAVHRDRAQSAELAAVHSEIDQLKAELRLAQLRAQVD